VHKVGDTEMGRDFISKWRRLVGPSSAVRLSAISVRDWNTSTSTQYSAIGRRFWSDLTGMAAQAAGRTITTTLVEYRGAEKGTWIDESQVRFEHGQVPIGAQSSALEPFVRDAYMRAYPCRKRVTIARRG